MHIMSTCNLLWMQLISTILAIVSGRIHIELTSHELTSPIQYQITNTFILAKSSATQSSLSINLTNSLDRIYTGQISIGTPATQLFNVVFDTGSADLWIFSAQHSCTISTICSDTTWRYHDCSADTVCCFFTDIMNAYNHNTSTTYTQCNGNNGKAAPWSITYGKGSASGHLSKDNVNIGGLTASNQIFAEATDWSDLLISCQEPMSGILGFAMKAASEDNTNTLIESLYNQNHIESKLFSVSLKDNKQVSELIIGDPDPNKYRNHIVWGDIIQATQTGMWFTQLTGILHTQNNNLSNTGYVWLDTCIDTAPCLALIDTGTSYITMPSAKYDILLRYLQEYTDKNGANCFINSYGNENSFICDANSYSPDVDLPYLWFQIAGYAFAVSPSQYMLSGSNSCFGDADSNGAGYDCLGISALDSMGADTYILGDIFLRQYYIIFDESNYRIGIASMSDLMVGIERPPVSDVWTYIEIIAMVIGGIGILVCVVVSCWRLRKPSITNSELWNAQRLIVNNNNEHFIVKPKRMAPAPPKRGKKSKKEREMFYNEANVITVLEVDACFNDTDDENDKVLNVLNIEDNKNVYQKL